MQNVALPDLHFNHFRLKSGRFPPFFTSKGVEWRIASITWVDLRLEAVLCQLATAVDCHSPKASLEKRGSKTGVLLLSSGSNRGRPNMNHTCQRWSIHEPVANFSPILPTQAPRTHDLNRVRHATSPWICPHFLRASNQR